MGMSPAITRHRQIRHTDALSSEVVTYGGHLEQVLSSDTPTPEQMMIDAETPSAPEEPLDVRHLATTDPEMWERLLARLPAQEADSLALYVSGEPPRAQHEVGAILGVTQAATGYRIARGLQRLRWMVGVGAWFTESQLRRALGEVIPDPQNVEMLIAFWSCGNYAETGRRVGIPDARDRILRLIDRDLAGWATRAPKRYGRLHEAYRRLVAEGLALGMRTRSRFDGR